MTTPTLHSSLRAQTNRVLAGAWLAALLCVVFLLGRFPWTMISLGLVSGVTQGILQRRVLRGGTAQLLNARSALEIRAAIVSTAAGRAQIKVLWGSLALYLAVLLVQHAEPLPLALLLSSAILAQWFVRELMTIGACAQLEKWTSEEILTSDGAPRKWVP